MITLGTTADFRDMVEAAQARGLWVMPYINPTWWDEESPTIQNLAPLAITGIAVLEETGQQLVVARTAGHLLTDYTELNPNVTQSNFSEITVLANWHSTLTHLISDHRVAPGGFLARTDDEGILAGVFAEYFNGSLLSAGEHYLIVERTPHSAALSKSSTQPRKY